MEFANSEYTYRTIPAKLKTATSSVNKEFLKTLKLLNAQGECSKKWRITLDEMRALFYKHYRSYYCLKTKMREDKRIENTFEEIILLFDTNVFTFQNEVITYLSWP